MLLHAHVSVRYGRGTGRVETRDCGEARQGSVLSQPGSLRCVGLFNPNPCPRRCQSELANDVKVLGELGPNPKFS